MVSVIVPAWNGRSYLPACLDALLAQGDPPDLEIVVVDNASVDGSADLVAEAYPSVRLVRNQRNLGFAGGCNAGLRAAGGDLLVLLNQDAVVRAGWLPAIAAALADPQVGVAGCKVLEADGVTLNHCGGDLDMEAVQTRHRGAGEVDRGQYGQAADVAYVTGAAFALRRDVLCCVGEMDERFFPGYYEDVDYCVRARQAGYRVRYVPDAVVVHHVSASTGQDWMRRRFYEYRSRLLFALKHLPADTFVARFVPAERERLRALATRELYAARIALAEVAARWPYLAAEVQPQAVAQVSGGLRSLLDGVRWPRGQPVDLAPIEPVLAEGRSQPAGTMGVLLPAIAGMGTAWDARAPAGIQRRPGLAGLLWALGRSLALAAYKTFLRRQVGFNGLVRRAFCALAAHLWDGDSAMALLSEQYEGMAARVCELEARLAHMEAMWEADHERLKSLLRRESDQVATTKGKRLKSLLRRRSD